MSKKRTTGTANSVECPACSATLDLSKLNVSIKGFRLRCPVCKKVLVTVGGLIAAITDETIQSVSLEEDATSTSSDSNLPVAVVAAGTETAG